MRAARLFGQNAVDPTSPDYQPNWSGFLNGCVPDATDLAIAAATMGYDAKAFYSGLNVAGKRIPWVLSGQCTRDAWRQAHAELQAVAKPGDQFIFGNSGHGGQYDTLDAVNGGETMCFYDGLLYDYEQHELMKAWPAGVQVLYIFDSCHSGGLDRSRRAPIRGAPSFIKPSGSRALQQMPSSDIVAAILQFCACQAAEVAEDGPQNGAFSGSLLAVWDQSRAAGLTLTYQSWIDNTVALMATSFAQHPIVNVLGAGQAMLAMAI